MENSTKFFQKFLLIHYFLFLIIGEASSSLDSLKKEYSLASKNYDIQLLKILENKLVNGYKIEPERDMLLGLIYWRKQLVSYCNDVNSDVLTNGNKAIEELNKAEESGLDPYIISSHKALSYLLMAGTSLKNGALYITFVSKELKN